MTTDVHSNCSSSHWFSYPSNFLGNAAKKLAEAAREKQQSLRDTSNSVYSSAMQKKKLLLNRLMDQRNSVVSKLSEQQDTLAAKLAEKKDAIKCMVSSSKSKVYSVLEKSGFNEIVGDENLSTSKKISIAVKSVVAGSITKISDKLGFVDTSEEIKSCAEEEQGSGDISSSVDKSDLANAEVTAEVKSEGNSKLLLTRRTALKIIDNVVCVSNRYKKSVISKLNDVKCLKLRAEKLVSHVNLMEYARTQLDNSADAAADHVLAGLEMVDSASVKFLLGVENVSSKVVEILKYTSQEYEAMKDRVDARSLFGDLLSRVKSKFRDSGGIYLFTIVAIFFQSTVIATEIASDITVDVANKIQNLGKAKILKYWNRKKMKSVVNDLARSISQTGFSRKFARTLTQDVEGVVKKLKISKDDWTKYFRGRFDLLYKSLPLDLATVVKSQMEKKWMHIFEGALRGVFQKTFATAVAAAKNTNGGLGVTEKIEEGDVTNDAEKEQINESTKDKTEDEEVEDEENFATASDEDSSMDSDLDSIGDSEEDDLAFFERI